MSFGKYMIFVASAVLALPVNAQVASETDCSLEENRGRDECLALPPPLEATNIIVGLAPLLAGLGAAATIAAVSAGGGGASSTPSTSPTE